MGIHAHMAAAAAPAKEVQNALSKCSTRHVRIGRQRRRQPGERIVRLHVSQPSSSMTSSEEKGTEKSKTGTGKAEEDASEVQKLDREFEDFALRTERQAVMKAEKYGFVSLEEKERSLSDYMALPPSQYSVLDGSKIVRLTDDTFRCELDTIGFFGYKVMPILTAKVELRERGCCITVVGAKIMGNSIVEKANDSFAVRSVNVVEWKAKEEDGSKLITSTASTEVRLMVPKWSPIPVQVVNTTGSFIVQKTLDVVVPRFLNQLSRDYANWAAGDDSRQPVD